MDTQIDYAVGLPIGLLSELPPPVDATASLFSTLQEPLKQGDGLTNLPLGSS